MCVCESLVFINARPAASLWWWWRWGGGAIRASVFTGVPSQAGSTLRGLLWHLAAMSSYVKRERSFYRPGIS